MFGKYIRYNLVKDHTEIRSLYTHKIATCACLEYVLVHKDWAATKKFLTK